MALATNELFSSNTAENQLRVIAERIMVQTFASGSGTLAKLTPVTFNTNTGHWEVWGIASADNEITTFTAPASSPPAAGTFTITVNGETTAAIAYNATAAQVQTALEALGNVQVGDVSVSGANSMATADAIFDITWKGQFTGTTPVISVDQTGISSGNDFVLSSSVVGVDSYGTHLIKGFVWPDAITLNSGGEVQGQVLMAGQIHYGDITLPAGQSVSNLKTALRNGVREQGIFVQGLADFR